MKSSTFKFSRKILPFLSAVLEHAPHDEKIKSIVSEFLHSLAPVLITTLKLRLKSESKILEGSADRIIESDEALTRLRLFFNESIPSSLIAPVSETEAQLYKISPSYKYSRKSLLFLSALLEQAPNDDKMKSIIGEFLHSLAPKLTEKIKWRLDTDAGTPKDSKDRIITSDEALNRLRTLVYEFLQPSANMESPSGSKVNGQQIG